MGIGRMLGRLALAGAGAVAAQGIQRALRASSLSKDLERTNFRGSTVNLAALPIWAEMMCLDALVGRPVPL
ncbi:hypothetical protein AB0M47_40230, partial [Hamadaea sp. NPDC051192]